ncbi:reverse transcriptase (RNA-dependent DNA polymerase) [Bacillus thuringiensis]|uniref:Reverse transcriptase (RNA-dependent DNA polymerase) n=1 Tax=Bacillus thuringiensis TaxID=1428 RepID=A0A4R4BET2_BACTU|nr:RNA-directed DNA polymerase [Bacillus thuringiensis]TCW55290.1 reverse transcriptase (RNA-dependent DNA polymerase) [Bacillus thuringiensis]TCW55497.1 reverse transcriptase (RNA-dependent DNA polymerase) [Bacillus thuringiensis]
MKIEQTNTSTDLSLEILLKNGYFPPELVPEFTTKIFSEAVCDTNFRDIGSLKNLKNSSRTTNYSIPKVKHSRRTLQIPNPLHQYKLSEGIINKWGEIKEFVNKSSISLTKPVIRDDAKRALNREYDFNELTKQRISGITDRRYILKTDISRYYSTIYTHSIPWALHGKNIAKKKRSEKDLSGNLIDKLVRNTQDGQTLGIPVGPDTSLVISEIIGNAIDQRIQEEISNLKGFRYTDDIELYFHTMSEAENALSILHGIMKDYELELNPTKTEIIISPDNLEPIWISKLKLYSFREHPIAQYHDLISYFNIAFNYAKQFSNERVLKYCLKRIYGIEIHPDNIVTFQSLLLSCTLMDPTTLPIIKKIFNNYLFEDHRLNYEIIQETIAQLIKTHVKFGNNYEVSWALSLSKSLNLPLADEVIDLLFNFEDPISSILLLDMRNIKLIKREPDLSKFKSLLTSSELYGRNWLFSYEANVHGWLFPNENKTYLMDDEFFSELMMSGVNFYDPTIDDTLREVYESFGKQQINENDFFNGY